MKYFMMSVLFLCTSFLHSQEEITPIPQTIYYDKAKAELGKALFFDPILSEDGTISCASCHQLPGSGADVTPFSFGIKGREGGMNTPTVLNSVYNFVQFWDGRAATLHAQAEGPIINPVEMGESMDEIIVKLNNSAYKNKFKNIYSQHVTRENLMDCIAEFVTALITPNSRFDKYLNGDDSALNAQEKLGYKRFKKIGCISCHNGINIGGNMYQKFGTMIEYREVDKSKTSQGRYNVTKRVRDRKVFKVPSLRNIDLSAPYLHDGSAKNLKEAIRMMRKHQLGLVKNSEDVADIEAFLKTLTGDMPEILR